MPNEIRHIASSHLRILLISALILILGILSSSPVSAQKRESSSKEHYSKNRYKQLSSKQSCKIVAKKWRKQAQPLTSSKKKKENTFLSIAKK